ncbi:MAG TPA: helix-turn-helix domain-containing protein [Nocardioides sp.]|uniref:helix-turn-helix domain-containing protein n=1 Tax=Nocardioides sp. TaxID=35761 RepID=UPI002D807830|nr:helix-turn-helix domain-containing protein [Nocardioides sp.]HET6653374.1 helix-turn-helix domain-containing protein [Nocardioides sp.]
MYDEGRRAADDTSDPTGDDRTRATPAELAGAPVVVRRNAAFAAAIGAAASAIAIAYLWRAIQSGAALDWALCVVITLVAGFHLKGLLDARTPLAVADELGVRIRLGAQWRGLPWDAVAAVEVLPRRGLLRDGRLVFRPHSLERALDGLETPGRRAAALNQKLYGAPLAVPMGLTTRTSAPRAALADELAALVRGRTTVEVLLPEPPEPLGLPEPPVDETPAVDVEPAGVESPPVGSATETLDVTESETAPASAAEQHEDEQDVASGSATRAPRRSLVGGLGTIVSRVAKGRGHDVDAGPVVVPGDAEDTEDTAKAVETEVPEEHDSADPASADAGPAALAVPLRDARRGLRSEVRRDVPATTLGAGRSQETGAGAPEGRELRRPGSVNLVFESVDTATVRPIAQLADPVEPLVIDDLAAEPAPDPVIGPQLAAARTRTGLSVDELAERTRIRPHVIESIEVDDFAPCGGDFYARGHLRTLARVLGQDPVPLLEKFDNRYATAPINARRVFEAELATGMNGSIRSTVGGPNWALLVGLVLSLVLVWGVVRLFATETPNPDDALLPTPAPALNGSAGVDQEFPQAAGAARATGPRLPITLVATQAGSRVVVRGGDGKVVYAGPMVIGERKSLKVDPPVRVQARNAGAIEVQVRGKDRGPVGELGTPGRRTFHRPAR